MKNDLKGAACPGRHLAHVDKWHQAGFGWGQALRQSAR